MDIETKGFIIDSPGDWSVGIPHVSWELTGGFIFETNEDLESFRAAIQELFRNSIAEDAGVLTIEEWQQDIAAMQKMIDDAEPSQHEIEMNREIAADLEAQRQADDNHSLNID